MSSSTCPLSTNRAKGKSDASMVEDPPNFLIVQTRSPLVSRDIDLLQQFKDKARVSMIIETN